MTRSITSATAHFIGRVAAPFTGASGPRRLKPAAGSSAKKTTAGAHLLPRIEAHLQEKVAGLFTPAGKSSGDALHDMRVGSRRLRVALRCFAPLFPEHELNQVQRQLRRITRTLGRIRAGDVNLQLLRKAAKRLPANTAAVQRKLTGELLADRVQHLDELRELQQTFATSHFEERLQALALNPRPLADRQVLEEAREFIARRRRVLRRRVKKCRHQKQAGPAFHKLRIAAKRYRYALESAAAVFRLQPVDRIRTVETLQDCLGDYHDLEELVLFQRACRRRWAKAENPLAGRLDNVLTFFKVEQETAFAKCQIFLNDSRTWLKKVKLELPHD